MRKCNIALHIFLIAVFMLSSISPACAFVSGKNVFEICGADGSIKTANIDPTLLDFLPKDNDTPSHKDIKKECAFCFAQMHINGGVFASDNVLNPGSQGILKPSTPYKSFLSLTHASYDSQAPPASLLF